MALLRLAILLRVAAMDSTKIQLTRYYRAQTNREIRMAVFKAVAYMKMQSIEGPYSYYQVLYVLSMIGFSHLLEYPARMISACMWFLHYAGYCHYLGVNSANGIRENKDGSIELVSTLPF